MYDTTTFRPFLDEGRLALRPEEFAETLGVSTKTLLRWRTDGTGPKWIKRGKVILYPLGDILDWLKESGAR